MSRALLARHHHEALRVPWPGPAVGLASFSGFEVSGYVTRTTCPPPSRSSSGLGSPQPAVPASRLCAHPPDSSVPCCFKALYAFQAGNWTGLHNLEITEASNLNSSAMQTAKCRPRPRNLSFSLSLAASKPCKVRSAAVCDLKPQSPKAEPHNVGLEVPVFPDLLADARWERNSLRQPGVSPLGHGRRLQLAACGSLPPTRL